MLSQNLISEVNTQIKYELYSAHLYIAMAAYCDYENLEGFANFFRVQAEEEKFHAIKFYNFLNQMGSRIIIYGLDEPENNFSSILDVFEKSLAHENFVTKRIYQLMDIASEEKEYATISLLKWFIDEQVEEENNFTGIIQKLKRINNDSASLYMLDKELGLRVFTPPTTTTQAQ
ncbi:MAG TPA: ferritin [Clostridiales bacterium]|nr:MAG: ferritin [Clostridiales bacterium GWD2_32_19]HCC08227.1 ferritin [Clostridiales bacterium]